MQYIQCCTVQTAIFRGDKTTDGRHVPDGIEAAFVGLVESCMHNGGWLDEFFSGSRGGYRKRSSMEGLVSLFFVARLLSACPSF